MKITFQIKQKRSISYGGNIRRPWHHYCKRKSLNRLLALDFKSSFSLAFNLQRKLLSHRVLKIAAMCIMEYLHSITWFLFRLPLNTGKLIFVSILGDILFCSITREPCLHQTFSFSYSFSLSFDLKLFFLICNISSLIGILILLLHSDKRLSNVIEFRLVKELMVVTMKK